MRERISFIINSLAGGGAERVMSTILSHSASKADRFDLELVILDDEPDVYTVPDWLEVVRLRGRGGLIESISLLRRHYARTNPSLSLSFLTRANVASAIVMSARGRPVILSERIHTSAHLGDGLGARIAKWLVGRYYKRADRVICVSKGVSEHLIAEFNVPADRVSTIYNPFDLDRISFLAREPQSGAGQPFALAMGRLVEAKGFAFLIRAFKASGIKQRLLIAGQGPQREELAALIEQLGLGNQVELVGFISNPYALLQQADFYILSSKAEGFPNGLVEAMAVGLPVIATDCPSGPAEILQGSAVLGEVVEAEYGLMVPCDDVVAMAAGLQRISDPASRARLAALAKVRAQDFAALPTTERYWQIIEETLANYAQDDRLSFKH